MTGNVARFLNKCAILSLKESVLLRVLKNANLQLSESALLKMSVSALQIRLENATLLTLLVSNGIHCNEVTSMQCNVVPKVVVLD